MEATHYKNARWATQTLIAGLLVTIAFESPAQALDDGWIDDAASPEAILEYYSGEGELEDAARQSVALHTVYRYTGKAIREKVGRQLTQREEAFREAYDVANEAVEGRIQDQYGRTSPTFVEFSDLKKAFRNDPTNLLAVLERFAPPIAEIVRADLEAEARRYSDFQRKGMIGGLILISGALAFVFLLATSIADRRISFGLEVDESDDRTVIYYTPGKHGVGTVFSVYFWYIAVGLFVGVLLAIWAVMFAVSKDYDWMEKPIPQWLLPVFTADFWWMTLLVLLALPLWLLALANVLRLKRKSVVVTRDGISAGGRALPRDRIGEIYVYGIGDGDDMPEEETTVLVGGNAASRAAAAGQLHGAHMRGAFNSIRRRLGRVNNKVCADYGEHRRVLAKRLPYKRACLVQEAIESAASRLHGRVAVGGFVTTAGD